MRPRNATAPTDAKTAIAAAACFSPRVSGVTAAAVDAAATCTAADGCKADVVKDMCSGVNAFSVFQMYQNWLELGEVKKIFCCFARRILLCTPPLSLFKYAQLAGQAEFDGDASIKACECALFCATMCSLPIVGRTYFICGRLLLFFVFEEGALIVW